MLRLVIALALIASTACTRYVAPPPASPAALPAAPAPTPTPAPTAAPTEKQEPNLVCRAMAKADPAGVCTPYYTDAGDARTHSAIYEVEKSRLYCVLTNRSPTVECGPYVSISQPQSTPQPTAAQPAIKTPAKAKGK